MLGVVWSVLNPLLMMIVMSFVFSFFLRYDSIQHYPLYLIVGNVTWGVFSESTSAGLTAILGAAPLLKKVKVNKFVFPAERVLFALVNFAFSLIAVVIVMLWEGVMPTPYLLLLPVCLLLLTVFCFGVSLLLSSLTVFFRDVIHLWSVLLLAWNYATPIFWPISMIQQVPYHFVRMLMWANPLFNYVQFMRSIFIDAALPSTLVLELCVFWAVIALVIGVFAFRKTEHKFILYI